MKQKIRVRYNIRSDSSAAANRSAVWCRKRGWGGRSGRRGLGANDRGKAARAEALSLSLVWCSCCSSEMGPWLPVGLWSWGWRVLRRFHGRAAVTAAGPVMVTRRPDRGVPSAAGIWALYLAFERVRLRPRPVRTTCARGTAGQGRAQWAEAGVGTGTTRTAWLACPPAPRRG